MSLDYRTLTFLEGARCTVRGISTSIRVPFSDDDHPPHHRGECRGTVRQHKRAIFTSRPTGNIFTSINVLDSRKAKHRGLLTLVRNLCISPQNLSH
jgi:hypothetical protein